MIQRYIFDSNGFVRETHPAGTAVMQLRESCDVELRITVVSGVLSIEVRSVSEYQYDWLERWAR